MKPLLVLNVAKLTWDELRDLRAAGFDVEAEMDIRLTEYSHPMGRLRGRR